jgi:hypothetical protein
MRSASSNIASAKFSKCTNHAKGAARKTKLRQSNTALRT